MKNDFYFLRVVISIAVLLFSQTVLANEVEIVNVEFKKNGASWRVHTTLKHDDSGWEHYADAWRVVTAEGNVLGERVLLHPHENEQPFTRSLSQLVIPEKTSVVFVEAHDKKHGWSKQRVRIDLKKPTGDRYQIHP